MGSWEANAVPLDAATTVGATPMKEETQEQDQDEDDDNRRNENTSFWAVAKLVYDIVIGVLVSGFYVAREIVHFFFPPTPKSLKGQHVLVSGAGRGLGRELCLGLAREGCSLISCVDVAEEGARQTATLVEEEARAAGFPGTRALHAACDVTDRAAVSSLVASLPPVDVLINNAGIVSSASITQDTDHHIRRLVDVNLMAHFWTIRSVLPSMVERGCGHIVGIASAAAFTAAANIAPYAATKYAVTGMMASLREEMRRYHPFIKITSVHPFFISPPKSSKEHWRKVSRMPDVSAAEVAQKTIEGIKRDKSTITIPSYLYHLLVMLMAIPTEAGDLWRDMFYAHISSLDENKEKKTNEESSQNKKPQLVN